MWTLWQTVQQTHSRPSELLCVEDPLVAYLFDAAVVTFGNIIENALQERIQIGAGANVEWKNKYELPEILENGFKLPSPPRKKSTASGSSAGQFSGGNLAAILALADQRNSGVKKWEYKPN